MIKVPPTMGARARGKLNKNGKLKQPSNMRGLTMPAMGGMAAASRDGGKMRRPVGFAKGGLAEMSYSDLRAQTHAPGSEYSSYDDPEMLAELASRRDRFHTDVAAQRVRDSEARAARAAKDGQTAEAYLANLQATGNEMRGRQTPLGMLSAAAPMASAPSDVVEYATNTGGLSSVGESGGGLARGMSGDPTPVKNRQPVDKDDALARLQAAVLRVQARREQPQGGINIPLLMAAAQMGAPTRTGSFFEAMGNAMTAGGNALTDQRKIEEQRTQSGEDVNLRMLEKEVELQKAANRQAIEDEYKERELAQRLEIAKMAAASRGSGSGGGVVMARINARAENIMSLNPEITREQALDIAFNESTGMTKAQYTAAARANQIDATNNFGIEQGFMKPVTPGVPNLPTYGAAQAPQPTSGAANTSAGAIPWRVIGE